jgi:FtsH-binding integral membrane protein
MALSYDDYIIGALILYIDIIRLFIEILKIVGKKN